MGQGKKLIVPGGFGFLGRIVAPWFVERGWAVVVLSRRDSAAISGVRSVKWDGQSLGDWVGELEQATAILNLAGRSVNCRYHQQNRDEILRSRVDSTRVLGEAIAKCSSPPSIWINSSTATIYKHALDRPMDELTGQIEATPEAKDAFSIQVAEAWERTFEDALTPHTRKVAIRSAMVLAPGAGGVFDVLHRLVRLRLGGAMGGGEQFVSWIHGGDFCRAVDWLVAHDDLAGPVNFAAPNPVKNREMMRVLRRLCGVRVGLPATRWMLEVGAFLMRTETELVIKSRRVVPSRLLAAGFTFQFPDIASAFADILRKS